MRNSNRLSGNSLSDLLVFGNRAGLGAATPTWTTSAKSRPAVDQDVVDAAVATALQPFELQGGENPYTLHQELRQTMNDLVGIIRKEAEMAEALTKIDELKSAPST